MEKFDLSADVKFKHENSSRIPTVVGDFAGSVGKEVEKCTITHNLETRAHQFSDDVAQVAKKLTIEIEFNDAVIQPHTGFEDDFCSAIAEVLAENVSGLFENSLSDQD